LLNLLVKFRRISGSDYCNCRYL